MRTEMLSAMLPQLLRMLLLLAAMHRLGSPVHARMVMQWQAQWVAESGNHQNPQNPKNPQTPSAAECRGESFAEQLPAGTEPSDLAYNAASQQLLMVSDSGHVLIFHLNATNKLSLARRIKVPQKPDLEGIALIPSRPGFAYLAVERPPAIIELDLESGSVTNTLPLDLILSMYAPESESGSSQPSEPNQGIESIAFIPVSAVAASLSLMPSITGFLVIGRQQDALLFIFAVAESSDSNLGLTFLCTSRIQPEPGALANLPRSDLSALTFWRNRLWLLYDKPKRLISISATEIGNALKFALAASPDPNTKPPSIAMLSGVDAIALNFSIRGQEGIAFSQLQSGQDVVFIAVDAPHKTGHKDLVMFPLSSFFGCFATKGISAIPTASA